MSEQDFASWLRAMGLKPGRIIADGQWRRCPTEDKPKRRNGSYKLLPGGTLGFGQNWGTMDEPAQWKAEGGGGPIPQRSREEIEREREERRRKEQAATEKARAYYEAAAPLRGGHPYLEAKDLDAAGCQGLRVDSDGWLVIPAYRGKRILSVQRISPEGEKRYWPGAPIKRTRYPIRRKGATVTVLCEGLATGLAVYRSLPTSRVWVCWDTSNLKDVDWIPPGLAVIAADNDHGTEEKRGYNPGIAAAKLAARELGCGIAYPEGIQGTDFADMRQECWRQRMRTKGRWETSEKVWREVEHKIGRWLMKESVFVPGDHGVVS